MVVDGASLVSNEKVKVKEPCFLLKKVVKLNLFLFKEKIELYNKEVNHKE